MANGLKYSVTPETEALKKGNFWLAVGDVQKTFGTYYTAIVPQSGGYSIYLNKPSDGPAIYVANSDAELIQYTKLISGTTFATGPSALNWYNTQTDKMVTNIEYPQIITNGLSLIVDPNFTPSFPKGGTSLYDLGPSGSVGTLFNGASYSYSPTGGGSIVFDGSDDYVSFNSSVQSYFTNCTFEAVVKVGKISSKQAIFSSYDGIGWGMEILADNTFNFFGFQAVGSFFDITSSSTVALNNTYVVTGTFTGGSSSSIYVNGVLQKTSATARTSITKNSNSPLVLGVAPPTAIPFKGDILNVKIYNRALTSSEVTQNYQVTLPRLLGQNIVTSGMVQYLNAGYTNSYSGSGTTWNNVAGVSGGNGTLRNTPAYSSANGGSIVFDGSDDYVEFTSSPTNVVTVSIWANLGTSGNFPLILAGNTSQYDSNLWNWSMYTYLGNFYVRGNSGSLGLISTPASSLVNKWINWVLVRNDGTNTCRVYQNGTLFGTSNESSLTDGTLSLGRGGNYLNGKISNVQIYNRAITASEVLQNYQASLPQILGENIVTSGMVAYYDAGYSTSYGGTGTSWFNVAGIPGATGTLINGPTYATGDGGAIVFDGSDDYMESSSSINITGNSPRTFECWAYTGSLSSKNVMGGGTQTNGTLFDTIIWYQDGLLRVIGHYYGGGFDTQSTLPPRNTININQWNHIVHIYDGSTASLYTNGVFSNSKSLSLNTGNANVKMGAGNYTGGYNYFSGKGSIFRIYNRALTPSEVLQNYNAQKSRFGL